MRATAGIVEGEGRIHLAGVLVDLHHGEVAPRLVYRHRSGLLRLDEAAVGGPGLDQEADQAVPANAAEEGAVDPQERELEPIADRILHRITSGDLRVDVVHRAVELDGELRDPLVTLGDDEVKVSLERVAVLRVREPRSGDREDVGDPDLGRDPEPSLLGGAAEFSVSEVLMPIHEERADYGHRSGPSATWGMPSTLIRSTSDRAIFR